jgi:hypothetical protein
LLTPNPFVIHEPANKKKREQPRGKEVLVQRGSEEVL